jgi:hypothetical protein
MALGLISGKRQKGIERYYIGTIQTLLAPYKSTPRELRMSLYL